MAHEDEPNLLLEHTRSAFQHALNRHGYGFQQAVLRAASEAFDQRKSRFVLEIAEFPAEVGGRDTRVDFVLRHADLRSDGARSSWYLISECKRVNPALGDWCFIRAQYTLRNESAPPLLYERLNNVPFVGVQATLCRTYVNHVRTCHVGIEIKSDAKGDSRSAGRGELEEAATQVMRGCNGTARFVATNPAILGTTGSCVLFPVLFTTARLWVSDASLAEADLTTGNIDLGTGAFACVDWLLYQYNQSPSVQHGKLSSNAVAELALLGEETYVRTIAIVSASGIVPFLGWLSSYAQSG